VWLERGDRVAQAVSWARAIQTNQWRSSDPADGEASFDADQIRGLVDLIGSETAAWASWFEEEEILPYRVTYEELLVNPRGTVEAIADFAGIRLPIGADIRTYPDFERQADELNTAWIRSYRDSQATA
jgi:LPS sulfotransferase NodH